MWKHYVYAHYKADTGAPFYIGKSRTRNGAKEQVCERAHMPRTANTRWMRTVAKHGLIVEIVASCVSDSEAQRLEKEIIAKIGREDLGKGPLINYTDGGDGHCGLIASEELRRIRSINSKGPRSPAWVAAIRKSRKNGGNGGVVKHGDKLSASWKKNISRGLRGSNNAWYGKPTPISRKIKNTITGEIYPTIKAAAQGEGINRARLYNYFCCDNSHYTDCHHLEKL